MTDITELAQSLKAAAEKASNGDWVKESGDGWDATCSNDDQANSGFIIAHFVGPDSEANREFVQLANPANVLALVEALENGQTKAIEQGRTACELFDEVTALRQRIAELESRLNSADKLQDSAFRSGLQHGFSLGQTDDQKGYEQSMAAYSSHAGIKVGAE
ncbi:ead/Ea22-like family protein [Klebsiella pneumoniae subsp. ozaenae]|uniref:ead/Ea22-like family protein n=1 Tax=Klebsiella pneumoniae TaxID=573 RepID=UPI000E2DCC42|nr:ead/Ea22-like family protein [Klebsiella pneumoniae]SXL46691.1 RelE family toxin-antitoxin system [Klebsiella pneumoniae]SXL53203.1 RelE family toxin-antitoxin system [Klebsiella pneumoniae]SXM31339.1 RelE family toxin-antitoxin system [Klebsiella pneumoniae]SXN45205.1 RelE family toxin-antitoxin system [Klebsiella pneumoniae]HBQ8415322.1 ead/Ea22-like family protein [Klebsiella pneumoniae]